jgi:hypothetical protein
VAASFKPSVWATGWLAAPGSANQTWLTNAKPGIERSSGIVTQPRPTRDGSKAASGKAKIWSTARVPNGGTALRSWPTPDSAPSLLQNGTPLV